MTIGIIANPTRDIGLAFAKEIAEWLQSRGHTPLFEEEEAYQSKFLIVLGGDGTMLQASQRAARYGTPMLGINLGTLGYLTDVDQHEGLQAIEKMLNGDFRREERIMLEVEGELALNDVFIRREDSAKLMNFRICVNGDHMDTLGADGVIVSTPTGSTAYNLSAGGPILQPNSEMMVITAVCPHTLYSRPWVISKYDKVSLTPVKNDEGLAAVYLDGVAKFFLKCGETIVVQVSDYKASVVKTANIDFFEVLRKKMGANEGTETGKNFRNSERT
ncbi:MAG: NAD(+)/NADH kinase [Defluviitaleaceae bacterium]|nr:NAD(+)/NADH kinase [Defluviitaleaceae bacterium]